jgi:hypothetical protein
MKHEHERAVGDAAADRHPLAVAHDGPGELAGRQHRAKSLSRDAVRLLNPPISLLNPAVRRRIRR